MNTTTNALQQPTRFRCRLTSRSEVKCAIAHGRNQNRCDDARRARMSAIAFAFRQPTRFRCRLTSRSEVKCADAHSQSQNRVMMRGGRV